MPSRTNKFRGRSRYHAEAKAAVAQESVEVEVMLV